MDTSNHIPLVDLTAINGAVRDDVAAAMRTVIDRNAFINGPAVASFEAAFASFCGTAHAVGVASGTAAIQLALSALGIGSGQRVATTPLTFIATAEAISAVGATPVFVDVEESTGGMSATHLSKVVDQVDAILPVHLYGQPVDMASIIEVSNGLPVIEDAAQAHGATLTLGGRRVRAGAAGVIGCFSFYPGKNLGAFGDAGGVTTDDEQLAARIRRLRDHGRSTKYLHEEVGFGHRLDTLQAAVLEVKLRHLEAANAVRAERAARYTSLLAGVGDLLLPEQGEDRTSSWHLYVLRTNSRDRLLAHLNDEGIGAGIHYPVPLHLQPAYHFLDQPAGAFPVSEAWASTCLSLPLSEGLTTEQQDRVVAAVREFFELRPST